MIHITRFAPDTMEMNIGNTLSDKDAARLETFLASIPEDEGMVNAVIICDRWQGSAMQDIATGADVIERFAAQCDKFGRVAVVGRKQNTAAFAPLFSLMPEGSVRLFDPLETEEARLFAEGAEMAPTQAIAAE